MTAEKLDADYSLVCYSGYGVISGYTSTGRQNQTDLVPKYYDKVGFSNVHLPEGGKIQDDLWDFSKQPDLVVINLGTNDAAYTSSDNTKMREYAAGYTEFLKTVRAKNPNAAIICTLGIMNTTLCDATDLAVMNYQRPATRISALCGLLRRILRTDSASTGILLQRPTRKPPKS